MCEGASVAYTVNPGEHTLTYISMNDSHTRRLKEHDELSIIELRCFYVWTHCAFFAIFHWICNFCVHTLSRCKVVFDVTRQGFSVLNTNLRRVFISTYCFFANTLSLYFFVR